MSFDARVFKIFIASPSDVSRERSIVRTVLNRWNEINSERYRIVLFPVGWETHSSPELGDHPQAIINKRILRECDLLIGVFWTRFGTPTENYGSGTEEEIEEHIKTGKPTMLYFSTQPVVPDSLDENQYKKVKDFKEKNKKRGIYDEYSSIEEFQRRVSEHIQMKVNSGQFFDVDTTFGVEEITPPELKIVEILSDEAKTLLKEASLDPYGDIISISSFDGKTIQTNGKNMNHENTPRSRALWENALKELEDNGLVECPNYKREIFKITKLGYEVADIL